MIIALIEKKGRNNMKCAMCGRDIRGRITSHVSNPDKKDIYVHPMPCLLRAYPSLLLDSQRYKSEAFDFIDDFQ